MISKTNEIGLIGEQSIILAFIRHGFQVAVLVGNNARYDMVVEKDGRFIRVQVKTTREVKDGTMIFATSKSNPYKRTAIRYDKTEIDCFAFYCIENGYMGLMPVADFIPKQTNIRVDKPKNNQNSKIHYAEDFEFERMIDRI